MIQTFDFFGSIVIFIGLFGVIFTTTILAVVYKEYWKSPYRR
jgi:hypothetical protein